VLRSIVNRIGNKFSVSDTVTFQLISEDFHRLISASPEKSFKDESIHELQRSPFPPTSLRHLNDLN
ncbi:MAG: hypothetical protein Q8L68_03180, partial [Methylococcales bacterium]|nr:hypothetical protein [Methylococcales bacterium]